MVHVVPKKISYSFLALLTLLATVLSFLVWDNRHIFPQHYRTKAPPVVLNVQEFVNTSKTLMNEVGGRTSTLWEVDVTINRRKTVVFDSINFGRIKELEDVPVQLFSGKLSDNEYVIKLLSNETYCGNLITSSVIGVTLRQYGVVHLCRTPIITSEGHLIGYVSIGFRDILDEKKREEVETRLRAYASTLIQKV